jgi:hypothetical protein
LPQGIATRTSQASISAALAAATANASARVPADPDGSLANMAQRDLDAALQLLADRAQYITGSTGAAIALRRGGKNDMLCRASAGSNAPELGALLSTEFGLSGESVRSRQVLRCDDVERDARVNREACRRLGIASVAVMPVVNDDEVLGVFELFSGKINAFGERDLTALKRLGEMVETAVKLSRAAEQVPEPLLETASAGVPTTQAAIPGTETSEMDDSILEVEGDFVADAVLPQHSPAIESLKVEALAEVSLEPNIEPMPTSSAVHSEPVALDASAPDPAPTETARPLLWSIALDPTSHAAPTQSEQGPVPPTLRNLRKCQACGFPVSPGRTLCVECEEKKWRGQLNFPRTARVSAGAAAAGVAPAPAPLQVPAQPQETAKSAAAIAKTYQPRNESARKASLEVPNVVASSRPEATPASPIAHARAREPELVLTAAMNPSRSWVSEHKFVILTLLAIGAGAAVLLLR